MPVRRHWGAFCTAVLADVVLRAFTCGSPACEVRHVHITIPFPIQQARRRNLCVFGRNKPFRAESSPIPPQAGILGSILCSNRHTDDMLVGSAAPARGQGLNETGTVGTSRSVSTSAWTLSFTFSLNLTGRTGSYPISLLLSRCRDPVRRHFSFVSVPAVATAFLVSI